MSFSPCYPEPYPWGSPVVPRSPEGIYKPVWQALDVVAAHRIYPATIAQCAGYIQRGDHWDAGVFDSVMTYINSGLQWAPYVARNRIWNDFVAMYNAIHAVGFLDGAGHYWDVLWARMWEHATQRWFWTQSRIQGPNTSIDLRTGATYIYNVAPWAHSYVFGGAIYISNGSAFGNVWDNPI